MSKVVPPALKIPATLGSHVTLAQRSGCFKNYYIEDYAHYGKNECAPFITYNNRRITLKTVSFNLTYESGVKAGTGTFQKERPAFSIRLFLWISIS